MGFPCGSAGNKSACNAGDLGSIPGLGRSPREGKGYPLQYAGLENSMDYGVAKSRIQLRDFHITSHHITSKSILQSMVPLMGDLRFWVLFSLKKKSGISFSVDLNKWYWTSLHVSIIGHLYISGKMSIFRSSAHFLIRLFSVFLVSGMNFLKYILAINPSSDTLF